MNRMQRIIAKHQHTDGLIALFPQHQMSGNISYDFGPNQGHGTLSNVSSRYSDHTVSKGHFMNASGYDWKVLSYNNILTPALIANFDPDAGAAVIFCKTDAAWDEGVNHYALSLIDDDGNELFMRKDTVDGRLYYRHDFGSSKSMNVDGMTTAGWFCMAMMWDRLVNNEVRIYLDGDYVERGINLGATGGADLVTAVIGALDTTPAFDSWKGGLGICAIYNTIKSDDEMYYLSKP